MEVTERGHGEVNAIEKRGACHVKQGHMGKYQILVKRQKGVRAKT